MDVEGTKEVKRMINLLAITVKLYHEIDADPSGSGSNTDRVTKVSKRAGDDQNFSAGKGHQGMLRASAFEASISL